MIRIERTKGGEVRVEVKGEPVRLPEPGKAIVWWPEVDYKPRLDVSKDVREAKYK